MYGLVVQNYGFGKNKNGNYKHPNRIKEINPFSVKRTKSVNVEPSKYTNPLNFIDEPKPKAKISYQQIFGGGYHDRKEFETAYQLFDVLARRGLPGTGGGGGFGGPGRLSGGGLFPESNKRTTLGIIDTPQDNLLTNNMETSTETGSFRTAVSETQSEKLESEIKKELELLLQQMTPAPNDLVGEYKIFQDDVQSIIEGRMSVDELDSLSNKFEENIQNYQNVINQLVNEIDILQQGIESRNEEGRRLLGQNEAMMIEGNQIYRRNQELLEEGQQLLTNYELLQNGYQAALDAVDDLREYAGLPEYRPQTTEIATSPINTQLARDKRKASTELNRQIKQAKPLPNRISVSGGGPRGVAITRFLRKVKKQVEEETSPIPSLKKLAYQARMKNVRRSSRLN